MKVETKEYEYFYNILYPYISQSLRDKLAAESVKRKAKNKYTIYEEDLTAATTMVILPDDTPILPDDVVVPTPLVITTPTPSPTSTPTETPLQPYTPDTTVILPGTATVSGSTSWTLNCQTENISAGGGYVTWALSVMNADKTSSKMLTPILKYRNANSGTVTLTLETVSATKAHQISYTLPALLPTGSIRLQIFDGTTMVASKEVWPSSAGVAPAPVATSTTWWTANPIIPATSTQKQALVDLVTQTGNSLGITMEQALYNYTRDNGIANSQLDTYFGWTAGQMDGWCAQWVPPGSPSTFRFTSTTPAPAPTGAVYDIISTTISIGATVQLKLSNLPAGKLWACRVLAQPIPQTIMKINDGIIPSNGEVLISFVFNPNDAKKMEAWKEIPLGGKAILYPLIEDHNEYSRSVELTKV